MWYLPRKDSAPELGFSRPTALHRFVWNERSLQKKGKLPDYQKALWEYIRMDHAEVIPKQNVEASVDQTFYLPSHGVVKANSTTTKLRVVFDGSAKMSTKVSLNDMLLPTPNLYPLLTDVLLEFRTHHIAVTGDIHKMFREMALDKRDWDMHRFLASDPDTNRLHNCRMKRWTFGIASSPFLAIQSATHKSRWNYVRTHQKPADHASRGLSPRQTVQNHLWWKGPPWMM